MGTLAEGVIAGVRCEALRAERRRVEHGVDAVKDSSAWGGVGLEESPLTSSLVGEGRMWGRIYPAKEAEVLGIVSV